MVCVATGGQKFQRQDISMKLWLLSEREWIENRNLYSPSALPRNQGNISKNAYLHLCVLIIYMVEKKHRNNMEETMRNLSYVFVQNSLTLYVEYYKLSIWEHGIQNSEKETNKKKSLKSIER